MEEKALSNTEKEEAHDEVKLYNPYHELQCARHLGESPMEFVKRLPPRETVMKFGKLPWIYVANPSVPRHDVEDLEEGPLEEGSHISKFVKLGDRLLDDLEEELVQLKIAFDGKPKTLLYQAAWNERAKTVDKIHKLSVDLHIKSGKVRQSELGLQFSHPPLNLANRYTRQWMVFVDPSPSMPPGLPLSAPQS